MQDVERFIQGEQGWRSGESARLPPMWPGFDSRTRRHMWVEFVVGSLLRSERFFSGYSGFPLSSKSNISKFQFDPGMHGHILNEFLRTPRCSVGKQITFTFTFTKNSWICPCICSFKCEYYIHMIKQTTRFTCLIGLSLE